MKLMVTTITIVLLTVSSVCSALAGDLSLYTKIGVMDWRERVDGKQFVRETGPTEEIGVQGSMNFEGVDFDTSVGIWAAELAYDGVKLETMQPHKTISGDIGFKGYAGVSVPVPLTDKLTVATMAGVNLNTFIRPICGELWLVLGAKTGLIARYENFEVKGGIQYPFATRDFSYPSAAGVKNPVTLKPKGMISPFAEVSFKINDWWTVGAYLDMWRWSASNEVPFKYVGNNPGSALAKSGALYQPDTNVINSGISLNYRF